MFVGIQQDSTLALFEIRFEAFMYMLLLDIGQLQTHQQSEVKGETMPPSCHLNLDVVRWPWNVNFLFCHC